LNRVAEPYIKLVNWCLEHSFIIRFTKWKRLLFYFMFSAVEKALFSFILCIADYSQLLQPCLQHFVTRSSKTQLFTF